MSPSSSDPSTAFVPTEWRSLLASMWPIRYFEDFVKSLFVRGLPRGSTHLYQGQEAPMDRNWGTSPIARMVTKNWSLFDAPPALVAADATPIPFAAALEAQWTPTVERIVRTVEETVAS